MVDCLLATKSGRMIFKLVMVICHTVVVVNYQVGTDHGSALFHGLVERAPGTNRYPLNAGGPPDCATTE